MPPHWKQRWIPLSPWPLSPWPMWLESAGLFPRIFTYRLLFRTHKARDMQHLPANIQMQQSGRGVSQTAVHGHTCAALINGHRKVSEGVNGSYNKTILIVCVFLKKQRSIYRSSQTNHGCTSKRRAPYGLGTGIAICSLLPVPQCTLVGIS